jgi:hypothetical protein
MGDRGIHRDDPHEAFDDRRRIAEIPDLRPQSKAATASAKPPTDYHRPDLSTRSPAKERKTIVSSTGYMPKRAA